MITVSHLTKYYGDYLAVDNLSFEIGDGHVYGFLGPNGAGKSTTMNIMTGCLSATQGQILINGFDIFEEPEKAKKCIGYLPEQPPLYLNETPLDYLRFVGEAKGLRGQALTEQIETVLEQTGIHHVKTKRISALSKGYKQRIGIAQALLGNPKVIILDEPTVGLDPLQIIEIRDLIKSLGQTHTVIFSSHILSEVQALCDRILIISGGKLVAFDAPENLEKLLHSRGEIRIATDAAASELTAILSGLEGVTNIATEDGADGCIHATIHSDAEDIHTVARQIFQRFAPSGKVLLELTPQKANLEDIFLELTEAAPENAQEEEES